jgi:hypothetical protein
MGMATTICLYFRGDGATRALEAFRRALGAGVEALSIHPNRDDSGYYGSADVESVEAAREAFVAARQPFPTLKAYFGILPAERDETAPRGGGSPRSSDGRSRQQEPKQSGIRRAEGKPIADGPHSSRGQERSRPAQADSAGDQGGRKPLRFRNRNDRRKQTDRDKQA